MMYIKTFLLALVVASFVPNASASSCRDDRKFDWTYRNGRGTQKTLTCSDIKDADDRQFWCDDKVGSDGVLVRKMCKESCKKCKNSCEDDKYFKDSKGYKCKDYSESRCKKAYKYERHGDSAMDACCICIDMDDLVEDEAEPLTEVY